MNNFTETKTNPQPTFDPENIFDLDVVGFSELGPWPNPLDLDEEEDLNISTEDTAAVQAALDLAQERSHSALFGSHDVELAATYAEKLLEVALLTEEERMGTLFVFFSTTMYYFRKTDATEVHLTRKSEGWTVKYIERTTLCGRWDDHLVAGPNVPSMTELGKRLTKSALFQMWPDTSHATTEPTTPIF